MWAGAVGLALSVPCILPWDINKSLNGGTQMLHSAGPRATLSVRMPVLPASLRLFPEQQGSRSPHLP